MNTITFSLISSIYIVTIYSYDYACVCNLHCDYLREFDVDFTSVAHELKSIFILFIILIWERAFVFVVLECLLFLCSRIKIIIQVQLQCRFYHQYIIIIGRLIYIFICHFESMYWIFQFIILFFCSCICWLSYFVISFIYGKNIMAVGPAIYLLGNIFLPSYVIFRLET